MLLFNKYIILICSLCAFIQALEEVDNAVPRKVTKKFYLSLDKANFFQAFVNCKQGEMELASILNEDESAALDSFLDPYKIVGSPNGFWLSGTHLIDTSTFQYYWLSTGARAIFTNWMATQPDNSNGQEHCLQWQHQNTTAKTTGWNDYVCTVNLRYVCEYI